MQARIKKIQLSHFSIGIICALVATFGLSFKAIIIKLVYQHSPEIDAITILVIRLALALPLFILLLKKYAPKTTTPMLRRDLMSLFMLGFIGFYLSAILDFSALAYIPAGLERLILFLYPTFVVLITFFLHPQQIKPKIIAALALSYLGILIVFIEQTQYFTSEYLLGSLLVFGAAVVFAIYTVVSVKPIQQHGAIRFTVYAMIGATFATVIHAMYQHGLQVFVQSIEVYALIAPMAVFSTVLPLILMAEGIKRIGAPNASILSTSGPIITLTLAYFMLGETFGALQAIGGLMIIFGVFLVAKQYKNHK